MYYIFVEVNSGQYPLKLSFVINKQEWIVAAVKSKRDIDIYPTLVLFALTGEKNLI